ncbi:MAG: bifunctional glutamate N-acetyltransferase/amino-acid acetyltransferase ArgJ [Phycisphaerales bacterium]|nr:bifunctional glutamate N-acetyltransferase/amino-acid acetyltransferase ArgJ [Phycisphaerales bacterium]
MENKTITAVRGFLAGAMHCGIKESGKPDLALLVSKVPAAAAGVFTTNKVQGAPVIIGREHIAGGHLQGCVINSGCANVCTGQRGLRDAREMCVLAARHLKNAGLPLLPAQMLPSSTGVIGRFLPMDKLRRGLPTLVEKLADTAQAGEAFAQGILTTDTCVKTAYTTLRAGGSTVTIAGNCKGSGMIAPNMATMLAYVATDAAIAPAALRRIVKAVADQTFNCVTVDQHTSTSDTFVCLANGMSGGRRLTGSGLNTFAAGLMEVCLSLAKQIARDGEGATKLVRVFVCGGRTSADAKRAALAIANSPLVKTAIHGGDPNWGRFVSAAGYSGANMDVGKSVCKVGKITVFRAGRPTEVALSKVEAAMRQTEIDITLDLGTSGTGTAEVFTCDLSREYITINADYHT